MSAWSLAVSVFGIIVYIALLGQWPSAFVALTYVSATLSLAGLGLSLWGWRKEERLWLCIVSVTVAIGYVLTMGLMVLNVLVYHWRGF